MKSSVVCSLNPLRREGRINMFSSQAFLLCKIKPKNITKIDNLIIEKHFKIIKPQIVM